MLPKKLYRHPRKETETDRVTNTQKEKADKYVVYETEIKLHCPMLFRHTMSIAQQLIHINNTIEHTNKSFIALNVYSIEYESKVARFRYQSKPKNMLTNVGVT